MATWKMVCEILGELPGTAQDPPDRMPAIRMRGKLLAYMPSTERSRPAHFGGDDVLVVRTDHHERAALIEEDPDTFAVTPHYQTSPAVLIRLARVQSDRLGALLVDAWRMAAPTRLVRQVEERERSSHTTGPGA